MFVLLLRSLPAKADTVLARTSWQLAVMLMVPPANVTPWCSQHTSCNLICFVVSRLTYNRPAGRWAKLVRFEGGLGISHGIF